MNRIVLKFSNSDNSDQKTENTMIIGLDVGGTHTDVVLLGKAGVINEVKILTDPSNLFETVLAGIEKVTAGVATENIRRMVLSTTLTTNAIVQKKLPAVGMIVSSGPGIDPELFRTNEHYFTVPGSIDHRGREMTPFDQNKIHNIADTLKKEAIRNIGIVSKFSVRNPAHELNILNLIEVMFDKIYLGHRVSGNLNFPRRIATTYLNAVCHNTHRCFFEAVSDSLKKRGLDVPIHVLKADGGTMSLEASLEFPAQTIFSGPAASVMGAIPFASQEDTIVMDIGGTTTDMAVLINRVPVLEPLGITLGGYKTLIRALDTHSIGMGGDSAVRVVSGAISIGPDREGPAMAFGGNIPTPTDALVVLGIWNAGNRQRAEEGIKSISEKLGKPVEDTASDILTRTCKIITDEARSMTDRINSKPVYTIREIKEGYRIVPKEILILGGPAPYFADTIEKFSGIKVRTVPRYEVANAIGAALARTTCEVTLFADTQQGIVAAPQENFFERVSKNYSKENALQKAFELLKQKALIKGSDPDDMEMEVIEELQFNMVQGFYTAGKNIRIKVQVVPGMIKGYRI